MSAYAITYGATRLGLLGQRQEARVMECSAQGGGRGQTSHACLVELASEGTPEPVRGVLRAGLRGPAAWVIC
ncbi:hypothetical protein WQ59_27765 [Streptomyces sp. KE1]|nr:hypothetical protein WQ59_27765 [Streptomyces sp. KE1]